MRNRVLVVGKPPSWLRQLVEKKKIIECTNYPDVVLLFEHKRNVLERIRKYRLRHIPIISQTDMPGNNEVIVLPSDARAAGQFLLRILHLKTCEAQRSPLTKLPGNESTLQEIKKTVLNQSQNWLVYADLNDFKIYNDRYGFEMGDRLILNCANIIEKCVGDGFIGHIGGDDFVFIVEKDSTSILDTICRLFDNSLVSFYPETDVKRNEITGIDRFGEEKRFGLVHISLAVLTNRYKDMEELNYAAAVIKSIVKNQSKNENRSIWVSDSGMDIWYRDGFVKILRGNSTVVKRTAIEVLGEIADETNFDLFIELLKDEDFLIRKSAVYALGRMMKAEALPHLLESLNDVSAHVRMRAAEALASYNDSGISSFLIKALYDRNIYVRVAAVKSLGRLKAEDALPDLLSIKAKRLVPYALKTLAEIGDVKALPYIRKMLNEPLFSKCAIQALAGIPTDESLEILMNYLMDADPKDDDINTVYKSIYMLSKTRAIKPVIENHKKLIVNGIHSSNPYYPIMILYEIGDDEEIEQVKPLLNSNNDYIRRAAVLYFSNVKGGFVPIAHILKSDRSPVVRQNAVIALETFGKRALPFIRKTLKDQDHRVRRVSAQAIMRILF